MTGSVGYGDTIIEFVWLIGRDGERVGREDKEEEGKVNQEFRRV